MLSITHVSGPLVTAKITDSKDKPKILETVLVGKKQLMGEIISIDGDQVKIQVYEETGGIQYQEPVELLSQLLSVELAPGLMGTIFDGIQRPLKEIDEISPVFIKSGIQIPNLNRDKKWEFIPIVQISQRITKGSRIGYVQETGLIKHWVMLPLDLPGKEFEVVEVDPGEFTIVDPIITVKDAQGDLHKVPMLQKWPVKIPRPILAKDSPSKIFKTGQRVIDTMFPIMLGGRITTPGPFGSGKSFTQQQIARWSDAEIVIFVGCGERGNELTEMVKTFPELTDPKTGKPLMDRTILIANTSNMPIAAREASIYTGVTLAEYYRDMGYNVVMMADSTSRWAEAMREVSQRLGEMPSEEGYPAYLSSRISEFYERSGVVQTLSGDKGSVTIIGTVSPSGGDMSEPVTQISLKNSQVFLQLDASLAAQRHYPAINWLTSFSLYEDGFNAMLTEKSSTDAQFVEDRKVAKDILAQEGSLVELVKIVGAEGLDNDKRLILEIAKALREDYLQQNGFDKVDTYCSFDKNQAMLRTIIGLYLALEQKIKDTEIMDENYISDFFDPTVKTTLARLKYREEVGQIKQDLQELLSRI